MTRGLVIAAPSSGSGKTLITLGILRALRDRGLAVAGAKSGPDFIDPQFHQQACGQPGTNLDAWAMPQGQFTTLAAAADAAILIVEGAMGLFDGAPPDGAGSTADLALTLGLPVVLVVDAARQAQSVGALVQGFARYRPSLTLAGVILNRVGSARHESALRAALSGFAVLGVLHNQADLTLPARHLGLVQPDEIAGFADFIPRAAAAVAAGLDLDAMLGLARALPAATGFAPLPPPGTRIALARDPAFAFAYPHLLAGWHRAGATIHPFSPLADQPPDSTADAVFLPGGYPELHVGTLAANANFRDGMQRAAARGATIYGECGGYMVLGSGLIDASGQRHEMLGLLDLETSFATPRRHLGYRRLQALGGPWRGAFRGHEFHFASTLTASGAPLFAAADAEGADLGQTGLVRGNVSGSFMHLIAPDAAA